MLLNGVSCGMFSGSREILMVLPSAIFLLIFPHPHILNSLHSSFLLPPLSHMLFPRIFPTSQYLIVTYLSFSSLFKQHFLREAPRLFRTGGFPVSCFCGVLHFSSMIFTFITHAHCFFYLYGSEAIKCLIQF